ncbi:MAG TPA: DUF192 domain-containing protein [Candidatus Paceibacterota bacterium]
MKKNFLLIAVILIAVAIFYLYSSKTQNTANKLDFSHEALINGYQIKLAFALTEVEKTTGLSFQKELKSDAGLLFFFEKDDYHGIWMKDMNFPIDVIWLDQDFVITDLKTNFLPQSFPEVVHPQRKSRYVLEIRSGSAQNLEMKIGDRLKLI